MSGAGGGGAGAVVRTGHLRKLKTMKKKFFVLRAETPDNSARLEYYESEKKYKSGAAPRRVIPLKSCYNITRRLDLKQKHVIALFTKEEQFCVVAENEQDLHSWLAAILKQHRNDDASDELLHPIQHVWQVNVQKKGLGASKNIQGLYNLCLTDKTLTLVKIKSQNNVISDLGIPERVEYSLKNIRRCGDSECFFYMEVGRQTATGAGELWMHSDDSNIAQSMHSTIYHAMRNCAKETESERDHIMVPKRDSAEGPMPARRQTYSDGRGRAGLANAENQPPNNSLTDEKNPPRVIKHHRTISLPTGCPLFQEPLKIVHERTRSAPLTGDEVDRAILEKTATHSSCKAVNGTDVFAKKSQWSRRASTGARFAKLSPAHSKNAGPLRNRCDSMPSRASSSFEVERPPPRHNDLDGLDLTRDEADSVEWHRTPRIPEEPDFCDSAIRDLMSTSLRGSSYQHSRTSSIGLEDGEVGTPSGYVAMAPHDVTGLVSASSGSVCSGTPSTSHRFSEYQLERATSHIVDVERPLRAYSVGSRPAGGWGGARAERGGADAPRHRAYSVGARKPAARAAPHAQHVYSAPQLPRASADDLMELDFSHNSPAAKSVVMSRTPPTMSFERADARVTDEYVDMSPRNAGYVEMRPMAPSASSGLSAPSAGLSTPTTGLSAPADLPKTPDGYVEMNYGRAATRPIAIAAARAPPPAAPLASPDERRRLRNGHGTPLGSQTIFPLSLDSPASPPGPPGPHPADLFDDTLHEAPHHPLTTVRELSEDGRAAREGPVSVSPSYVALAYKPVDELPRTEPAKGEAVTAGATVVLAGKPASAARFSIADDNSAPATPAPTGPGTPLNYASLDLEPCGGVSAVPARTYTQIDFVRSEKLHADAN